MAAALPRTCSSVPLALARSRPTSPGPHLLPPLPALHPNDSHTHLPSHTERPGLQESPLVPTLPSVAGYGGGLSAFLNLYGDPMDTNYTMSNTTVVNNTASTCRVQARLYLDCLARWRLG